MRSPAPVFVQLITTPGISVAQYESVQSAIGSDRIGGILLSVAGFIDGDMYSIDVWDTPASAERFAADRLFPAFERTGNIPDPNVTAVEFDGRMTLPAALPATVHTQIARIPGLGLAEYGKVEHAIGPVPVPGHLGHLVGVTAGALYVVDLWRDHTAVLAFLTGRLYPAFERAGVIPNPDITVLAYDARVVVCGE